MDRKVLAKVCQTSSFRTGIVNNNAVASFYRWETQEPVENEYDDGSRAVFELCKVKRLQEELSRSYSCSLINPNTPWRFLGSNRTMGLVPPEAQERDLVCRFWGCDVAAVLRWDPDKEFFHIIGRVHVATRWQGTEDQPFSINIWRQL